MDKHLLCYCDFRYYLQHIIFVAQLRGQWTIENTWTVCHLHWLHVWAYQQQKNNDTGHSMSHKIKMTTVTRPTTTATIKTVPNNYVQYQGPR